MISVGGQVEADVDLNASALVVRAVVTDLATARAKTRDRHSRCEHAPRFAGIEASLERAVVGDECTAAADRPLAFEEQREVESRNRRLGVESLAEFLEQGKSVETPMRFRQTCRLSTKRLMCTPRVSAATLAANETDATVGCWLPSARWTVIG